MEPAGLADQPEVAPADAHEVSAALVFVKADWLADQRLADEQIRAAPLDCAVRANTAHFMVGIVPGIFQEAWQLTGILAVVVHHAERAAGASILLISACACGERTTKPNTCPDGLRSSLNRPLPESSRRSSFRLTGWPFPNPAATNGAQDRSGPVTAILSHRH
jgi:hypothetical protein